MLAIAGHNRCKDSADNLLRGVTNQKTRSYKSYNGFSNSMV